MSSYIRTEAHRERMRTNNPMKNPVIAKKSSDWHRGKKRSAESRKRMSLAAKGQRRSPKTEYKKGQKHLQMSDETKEKIRQAVIKQHLEGRAKYEIKGEHKRSDETKVKIRAARSKQIITKEHRKNISEGHIRRATHNFRNTGIEMKIEHELKLRELEYQKHVPLCKIAVVDFYLPKYKIVIECDGCYWHGCPIHYPNYKQDIRVKDEGKTSAMILNGFNVYRFWEHDINSDPAKCVNSIKLYI